MDILDKLGIVAKALMGSRRNGYSTQLMRLDVYVLCQNKEQAKNFKYGTTIEDLPLSATQNPVMVDNAMLIELIEDARDRITNLTHALEEADSKLVQIESVLNPLGRGQFSKSKYTNYPKHIFS